MTEFELQTRSFPA